MEKLSTIVFNVTDRFRSHKHENELEAQGFADYMDEIQKERQQLYRENKELKMENNNYKNDILGTENELLKEQIDRLNDSCFKLTQENSHLSDRVGELEKENKVLVAKNKDLKLINIDNLNRNTKLSEQVEEIKKENIELKTEHDEDLVLFGEITKGAEKAEQQRDIYKEIINEMCGKFEIEHSEVFKIIDKIEGKEMEK